MYDITCKPSESDMNYGKLKINLLNIVILVLRISTEISYFYIKHQFVNLTSWNLHLSTFHFVHILI